MQEDRAIPEFGTKPKQPAESTMYYVNIADILREHGKHFRQIKYYLRDDTDGRCAIGVIVDYSDILYRGIGYDLQFDYTTHMLLQLMNDYAGYTFEEIADWLDHNKY